MKYNKLVRDKIPEYIKSKGGTPVIHVSDEKEYWQKLKEKLNEEVAEFQKDENIEEFADILEVLEAIQNFKSFKVDEVQQTKSENAEEKGNFRHFAH